MLGHGLTGQFVAMGPAVIADRSDIDETHLEGLLCPEPAARQQQAGASGAGGEQVCGVTDGAMADLPRCFDQVAGRNGWPRQAGASSRPFHGPPAITASTKIVARYGSIDITWAGTPKPPEPWA